MGPQAWRLIATSPEAACSGVGGEVGCLTGGTELTAVCNGKALCHSQNVQGNEMNSLSGFLQRAVPKNTMLSAQMGCAWFWRRACCKLQTSPCGDRWIPENQTLAVNWQFGKRHKNVRVPVALSDQMYCQDSGQPIWKPHKSQRLAATSLGEESGRRHSPMSRTLLFLPGLRKSRAKRVTGADANTNLLLGVSLEKMNAGRRKEWIRK